MLKSWFNKGEKEDAKSISNGQGASARAMLGVKREVFLGRDNDYWAGHTPPNYSSSPRSRIGEVAGGPNYGAGAKTRPRGDYARSRTMSIKELISVPESMAPDFAAALMNDPEVAGAGAAAKEAGVAQDRLWRRALNTTASFLIRMLPASKLPLTEKEKKQIARGDAMQMVHAYHAESSKIIAQVREEFNTTLASCRERLETLRRNPDFSGEMALEDRQFQRMMAVLKIRFYSLKDVEDKDDKVRNALVVMQSQIHGRRLNQRALPMIQRLVSMQKEMASTDDDGNKIDAEDGWNSVKDELDDLQSTGGDADTSMDQLLQSVISDVAKPRSRDMGAYGGGGSMSEQDMLEMLRLIDPSLVMKAPAPADSAYVPPQPQQHQQQHQPIYTSERVAPRARAANKPRVYEGDDHVYADGDDRDVVDDVQYAAPIAAATAGVVSSSRITRTSVATSPAPPPPASNRGYVGSKIPTSEIKRVRERSKQFAIGSSSSSSSSIAVNTSNPALANQKTSRITIDDSRVSSSIVEAESESEPDVEVDYEEYQSPITNGAAANAFRLESRTPPATTTQTYGGTSALDDDSEDEFDYDEVSVPARDAADTDTDHLNL